MAFTKDTASTGGRKGGETTKKRLAWDPEYFSRIGRKGWETRKKQLGENAHDFFSRLGKMSPKRGEQ